MLSWISCPLVSNFTDVDGIAQQGVERTSRERSGTRPRAVAPYAKLGSRTTAVEFFFEESHAAEFAVPLENLSHHNRLRLNHHQLPLVYFVAEGNETSHPHSFAFR